jgi:hypothetical protein
LEHQDEVVSYLPITLIVLCSGAITELICFRMRNFSACFSQNLYWKLGRLTPSFGSTLAVLLKRYFFSRNKTFLFFKIESWNFQYLFEIEFRETSQNFNSFCSFRQLLFSFFLWVVWLSWNFERFHEILFQTDSESFSLLSWKTKTFYS